MKKRRISVIFTAAIMAGMILGGCGSEGSGQSDAGSGNTDSAGQINEDSALSQADTPTESALSLIHI